MTHYHFLSLRKFRLEQKTKYHTAVKFISIAQHQFKCFASFTETFVRNIHSISADST